MRDPHVRGVNNLLLPVDNVFWVYPETRELMPILTCCSPNY
jgi:hypothetical protein